MTLRCRAMSWKAAVPAAVDYPLPSTPPAGTRLTHRPRQSTHEPGVNPAATNTVPTTSAALPLNASACLELASTTASIADTDARFTSARPPTARIKWKSFGETTAVDLLSEVLADDRWHRHHITLYCKRENKVGLGLAEGLNNKIRGVPCNAFGDRDEKFLKLQIIASFLPQPPKSARLHSY